MIIGHLHKDLKVLHKHIGRCIAHFRTSEAK